jgi:amino acid adenylation domain-containing protein
MNAPNAFVRFSKAEIEQSIPERFAAQVLRHGSRIAVKGDTQSYTYVTLDAERTRIANAIIGLRDGRSEPVILLLQQDAPLLAAILGALSAGKIYVPLDANTAPDLLEQMIDDCDAPLILADASTVEKANELADTKRTVLDISRIDADSPGHRDPFSLNLSSGLPAYIYYTSGSTGTPKGVVDSHRNVLHNVMRYTNNLKITPKDRLSLVQSSSFSGAVSNVFCALLNGASVYPFDLRRHGGKELAEWLIREQLTIFHSVPAIFERLVGAKHKLPSLRIVRLEGDQSTRRHVDLFQQNFNDGCRLVNGFGTTETGIIRQYFIDKSTPFSSEAVPIGYPIEDMEVVLLDDNGQPADTGEIVVRSRYLAMGYWNQQGLTDAAFVADPAGGDERVYRTGDLGSLATDGCLTYRGRKHFDFKVWGRRVDVHAIEIALRSIEGIEDAVLGVPEDSPGAQQLVAYTINSGPPPTVGFLRRVLTNRFPNQPIPSRFVTIDHLPTDANGKVDRRALPAPDNERPSLDEPFVAPGMARERTIAACFSEVLGISKIGINDNFLDLGGDSIQAVELALLMEEQLATRIPSEMFWDKFTVAQFAAHLGGEHVLPNLITLRPEGTRPPLFLLHSHSGLVLEYRNLTAGLTEDRPVIAVQFNGEPERYVAFAQLPDLATHYVLGIQRVQPTGPYLLCGQCFGGLIAFEVAQQLRAKGEAVELLALIDTFCPTGTFDGLSHHFSLTRLIRRLSAMRFGEAISDLRTRIRSASRFALGIGWRFAHGITGLPLPRFLKRPTDIHRLAEAKYHVTPYDGYLVSIVAGTPHNQAPWEKFAGDRFNLVQLPVVPNIDSDTHLTDAAYLTSLTDALNRLLDVGETTSVEPTPATEPEPLQ